MGFDLKPRNKDADWFHFGAFSWTWMLEQGVGLVVGYGRGFSPGEYLQIERPDGYLFSCNDGARVTAKEAKEMARMAELIADYQDALDREWQRLPEAKQRQMLEPNRNDFRYNTPVRRDFVERLRLFAAWAKKSGGFRVH